MKLKDKHNNPNEKVVYKLYTGDGEWCRSDEGMPATVAEEIAKRADAVEVRDEKGFELLVNGKYAFPKDIFEFDEGEVDGIAKPKRSGRPTKAELLEEAKEEMTNPQLHHAIEEAKQENAQKRGGK